SPLTTHNLPLTTYHSPLTTHHLPLTTYHSPNNPEPQTSNNQFIDFLVFKSVKVAIFRDLNP
ncbi:hypothetical protein, partial [uncultured Flavobacterium sp.]|uniref:hypothetical protein n=1 Tax=uncultured Flavobacterium sp. TaxID=165435 RepID=UPI0030CA4837